MSEYYREPPAQSVIDHLCKRGLYYRISWLVADGCYWSRKIKEIPRSDYILLMVLEEICRNEDAINISVEPFDIPVMEVKDDLLRNS